MRIVSLISPGFLRTLTCATVLSLSAVPAAEAEVLSNPVLFVTQVPVWETKNTVTSVGGNHLATTAAAPRGGDLMVRYPSGTLKNLTRSAGYGEPGMLQGAASIAVRDPCVHWDGKRALFAMVIGTDASARWQIYEVAGLGANETPVLTRIASQPASYNNVQPCYTSADDVVFVCDRPREGAAHLFPARDEQGKGEINTGLWELNTTTGALTQLEHSPSGSFDPFVDSFGRIVFSRWDHLQRDTLAAASGFDFDSEAEGASRTAGVWSDIYPEPFPSAADPFGLKFDQFLPWTINQDGTDLLTINHLGRHELTPAFRRSRPDTNLEDFLPLKGSVRAGSFLQISQNLPSGTGRYVATDALFTSVTAGRLLTFIAPPGRPPDTGAVVEAVGSPVALSRDAVVLKDGRLIASVSRVGTFIGGGSYGEEAPSGTLPTTFIPGSGAPFKLTMTPLESPVVGRPAMPADLIFVLPPLPPLNGDIIRSVTNIAGSLGQTFNGALWELQPVEVTATPRPPVRRTPMDMPEIEAFSRAGVSPTALRAWMAANDLAVLSCRNVTTRDVADKQQPVSLRVDGGVETLAPGDGPVYSVSALQFFQADYVRGYGLSPTDNEPDPGRRVAARPMHDDKGANQDAPSGAGSVSVSSDGSVAAFVPARRALTWQLEDPTGNAIVRERYWLSFRAGEIRSCTSCHGVNSKDQAGHTVSTNPPEALRELLGSWKQTHPEATAGSFRVWSEGLFGTTLDPAADTDGDGASNFEEFAIGSSPLDRGTGGTNHRLRVSRQRVGDQELTILTFSRSTMAYGLEIALESSDDMTVWDKAAFFNTITRVLDSNFALTPPTSEAGIEHIQLTDLRSSSSAPPRFYRLRLWAP